MTTLVRTLLNMMIAPVAFLLDMTYQAGDEGSHFLRIIGSCAGLNTALLDMIMQNLRRTVKGIAHSASSAFRDQERSLHSISGSLQQE